MSDLNIDKLKAILNKWKRSPENNVDLNKLADETLKVIDEEPLIKDICQAFLCSISIKTMKDYDGVTYDNILKGDKKKDMKRRK